MMATDLVMQRDPSGQTPTMTDDRPLLCRVSPCCAHVAQTSHSHVTLAGRSVKLGDRRSKMAIGNVHTAALEPAARGRLDASHHTRSVCISKAPTMLPAERNGLLLTSALAEWPPCVRIPSS